MRLDYPVAWLDQEVFASVKISEEAAEHSVGEAMEQSGLRGYFTRSQLAKGSVPATAMGQKYLEQLFAARRMVRSRRSSALYSGRHEWNGPRLAVHIRHSRSFGFLRNSFPERHLPHACRTGGPRHHFASLLGVEVHHARGGTRSGGGARCLVHAENSRVPQMRPAPAVDHPEQVRPVHDCGAKEPAMESDFFRCSARRPGFERQVCRHTAEEPVIAASGTFPYGTVRGRGPSG